MSITITCVLGHDRTELTKRRLPVLKLSNLNPNSHVILEFDFRANAVFCFREPTVKIIFYLLIVIKSQKKDTMTPIIIVSHVLQ